MGYYEESSILYDSIKCIKVKRIYNYHGTKNKITSVLEFSLKGCRKDLTPHSHKQDKRNKKLKYDYQNERYVTRFSLLDT